MYPDHPEEAVNDHFELGAHSLTFLIYLYRCAATGAAIYVGQTMRTLGHRDSQHLSAKGAPGSFDDVYTDRDMFTLEILDTATFAADVQAGDEYRDLLRRAAAWADRRETEEIDRHGTYDPHGPGLNRTRGGQGDILQALRQASYIQSCKRWTNVYRPEFEAYLAKHRTLRHIPTAHPTLGNLVGRIRHGTTSVPPEHLDWLRANGFRWSARNVAAHVAGYMSIPCAELPAEAAESEAVMLCLYETLRLELFGWRSLLELVGLYNEHRARL
jgi:hypothetical protein